jgi:serine/threonine protein phosphatase 1
MGLPNINFVTLMGNHEECMIRALGGDEKAARKWFDCGGASTLAEVGLSPADKKWREEFRSAVGDPTLLWVAGLPLTHRIDDLLFVHAGIDPGQPLVRQDRATLLWTRGPFLGSPGPYAENVAVIHGHTPQEAVDLQHPNRINLDTGAFRSGRLSALVIAGERMSVITAFRGSVVWPHERRGSPSISL